jgi:hypothetical protein
MHELTSAEVIDVEDEEFEPAHTVAPVSGRPLRLLLS